MIHGSGKQKIHVGTKIKVIYMEPSELSKNNEIKKRVLTNHCMPKLYELGLSKKSEVFSWAIENNILVPHLIFSNCPGIACGSIEDAFDREMFVLKYNEGFSTNGVWPFVRANQNTYKTLFKKYNKYDHFSIESIRKIANDNAVLCEESLLRKEGDRLKIPADYKFYILGGKPWVCVFVDRNHGVISTLDVINKKILKMGDFFESVVGYDYCDNEDIVDIEVDFDAMLDVCTQCYNALNKPGFVSVDMYYVDGRSYLGEITFNPGALFYNPLVESEVVNFLNEFNS